MIALPPNLTSNVIPGGYIEPHMDSSPDNRVEGREEEDELEIKMGGERLMTFMVQYNLAQCTGTRNM